MRRQVNTKEFLSRWSYLTLEEARVLLAMPKSQMETLIQQGALTVYRFSGRRYVLKSQAKAMYEERLRNRKTTSNWRQ